MSKNHYFLDIEEFVNDPSFRHAVFEKDSSSIQYWEQWLQAHPESREHAEEAKRILLSMRGNVAVLSENEINQHTKKILDKVSEAKRPNVFQSNVLRIAASIIFILGVGFAAWQWALPPSATSPTTLSGTSPVSEWVTIQNNESEQRLVLFPDGSSAMLQKNSSVRFPRVFEATKREVSLTGESFFEVAKNAKWPFVVNTNGLTTQVVGTSFIVRAYPTDNEVKVFVKTGTVWLFRQSDVQTHQNKPNAVLTAHQQATFLRKEQKLMDAISLQVDNVVGITAINESFEFKRTPLEEVFETLEKIYQIDIVFDAEMAASCTLTAALGDEPLKEKLEMIANSIGATVVIDGKTVTMKLQKRCN